jgi:hypothetical protein
MQYTQHYIKERKKERRKEGKKERKKEGISWRRFQILKKTQGTQ